MGETSFINVRNIFGGKKFSAEQEEELFREVLILTLSRMTRADLNVDPAEVDAVIDYVKKETDADLSSSTIRVAASSELFEETPIEKRLKKISKHLSSHHRVKIVNGLKIIIGSDDRVSDSEKEFFNAITNALNVTPSELAGL